MQDLLASIDALPSLSHDLTPEYDVGHVSAGPRDVHDPGDRLRHRRSPKRARTGSGPRTRSPKRSGRRADLTARPLMPLRKGHLAMLVAAGFLDNLELETPESRVLVKGQTKKEMVLVEEGETHDVYREQLRTSVVTLDLDSGRIERIEA